MTKAQLIEQIADATERRVTRKDCGLVIDTFLSVAREALLRGDRIELRGFGTFKVRHGKARKARNPRTGKPVDIPARDVPVFRPSNNLRSLLRRGHEQTK